MICPLVSNTMISASSRGANRVRTSSFKGAELPARAVAELNSRLCNCCCANRLAPYTPSSVPKPNVRTNTTTVKIINRYFSDMNYSLDYTKEKENPGILMIFRFRNCLKRRKKSSRTVGYMKMSQFFYKVIICISDALNLIWNADTIRRRAYHKKGMKSG